ncbi:Tryptophan synthase alpha chain [Chlamydiales bacterium SCGC AG-110-P3]|nr:Tryptophan synthase alpha chain [Chlamydiales bacterium SCGC AG-110-P3]
MGRIKQAFSSGKIFTAYVTAGDGSLEYSIDVCRAMIAAGVDLLEVGIPFSDPIADGPVIEAAMKRALDAGATPALAVELVRRLRTETEIPIILFGYYNTILSGGMAFLQSAKEAGGDGILVVDLPIEEGDALTMVMDSLDLDTIQVVSPSTSDERLEAISAQARGFLYYACRKGTTGVQNNLPGDYAQRVQAIRAYSHLPVLSGFGIADREAAGHALKEADGFVVGSAIVAMIGDRRPPDEIGSFVRAVDPRRGVAYV